MYFKTTVIAGKTIEVMKGYKRKVAKGKRAERSRLTPEEMDKVNQNNAAKKLRWIIAANFQGGDFHVVLTYLRENRTTPAEAKKIINKFIRAMRQEYKKVGAEFKYIHVTEYKNTSIHHHIIINNLEYVNVTGWVKKHWEYGRPKFTVLDDTGNYHRLADYLIKETSKTFREKDSGHKQRYSCSRNLVHPEPVTEIIHAEKWRREPKAIKGYYIVPDSVNNGISNFDGYPFQSYIMVSLDAGMPEGLNKEQRDRWRRQKAEWELYKK